MARRVLAAVLAAACLAPAAALAASPRDAYTRRHLSFTEQGVFKKGYQDGCRST